jgi:hypothetical protein
MIEGPSSAAMQHPSTAAIQQWGPILRSNATSGTIFHSNATSGNKRGGVGERQLSQFTFRLWVTKRRDQYIMHASMSLSSGRCCNSHALDSVCAGPRASSLIEQEPAEHTPTTDPNYPSERLINHSKIRIRNRTLNSRNQIIEELEGLFNNLGWYVAT